MNAQGFARVRVRGRGRPTRFAWSEAFVRPARQLSQVTLRALFEPWFFRGNRLAERRRGPFSFIPRRPRRRWR